MGVTFLALNRAEMRNLTLDSLHIQNILLLYNLSSTVKKPGLLTHHAAGMTRLRAKICVHLIYAKYCVKQFILMIA